MGAWVVIFHYEVLRIAPPPRTPKLSVGTAVWKKTVRLVRVPPGGGRHQGGAAFHSVVNRSIYPGVGTL